MVDTLKDEYIILELIPTAVSPDKGQLVQLSAVKLRGLNLLDRFDYRLKEDNIKLKDILNIISYDKDAFEYLDSDLDILDEFDKWTNNLPILYIADNYTLNYLDKLSNKKESILKHLNEEYSFDIIEKLMKKYNIQPTNYIVDVLYESLIYESNNKRK